MEQKSGLFDFHAGTSSPRGGWNSIQRKISATSYQTHVSNKLDLFQRHAQRGLRRTTVLDTVQSFRRKRYPASFRYESLSCTVTRPSRFTSCSPHAAFDAGLARLGRGSPVRASEHTRLVGGRLGLGRPRLLRPSPDPDTRPRPPGGRGHAVPAVCGSSVLSACSVRRRGRRRLAPLPIARRPKRIDFGPPLTRIEPQSMQRSMLQGVLWGDATWGQPTVHRLGLESPFRERGRPKKPTPCPTSCRMASPLVSPDETLSGRMAIDVSGRSLHATDIGKGFSNVGARWLVSSPETQPCKVWSDGFRFLTSCPLPSPP